MKAQLIIQKNPFDSRFGICRFLFKRFKFSMSLYPYFWKWESHYKEFYLTILGLNIHYRGGIAE